METEQVEREQYEHIHLIGSSLNHIIWERRGWKSFVNKHSFNPQSYPVFSVEVMVIVLQIFFLK